MVSRLCLDCGRPTAWGSRCPACSGTRGRAKATQRGGAATHRFRKAVLARDGHRCKNCGEACPHPKHHEVDHIVPVSKLPGRSLLLSNGRTLCAKCHVRIGAR